MRKKFYICRRKRESEGLVLTWFLLFVKSARRAILSDRALRKVINQENTIEKMKRFVTILILVVTAGAYIANAQTQKPQKFSVGINAFEALNFGTPNIEVGYTLTQRMSIHAGGRYNNWGYGPEDAGIQNRKRTAWLGVRYWPWYVNSGWFIQVKGQYNEINSNIFTQKFFDPFTNRTNRKKMEGDAFGGGIAAGYDVMLSKHWNIEFGLGVWCGVWTNLSTYSRRIGGYKIENECWQNKFFVLPDDVLITFKYIF